MLLNHILLSFRQSLIEDRDTLNLSDVRFIMFPLECLMIVAPRKKDSEQLDRCWTDWFNNSLSLCLYTYLYLKRSLKEFEAEDLSLFSSLGISIWVCNAPVVNQKAELISYAKIRAVQNPGVCLNSAPHFFCLHFQQIPEKLLIVCILLFHRSPTAIRSSFSLMKIVMRKI